MAACAVTQSSEAPVVGSYWVPGTFGDVAEEFIRGWYSNQLCAMGEPTLTRPSSDGQRIRFLWLRSFHPGIAVRLEKTPETANLIAVELAGAGGYAPGEVARRIERGLSPEEWSEVRRLIRASGFWGLPIRKPAAGTDGAQWIVEVSERRRYHVVDRWSGGEIEELGSYLLELSGLDPEPVY